MNASEVNIQFTLTTSIQLTSATCTLTVVAPDGTKQSLSVVVGTTVFTDPRTQKQFQPFFWAYRTTLATDFAQAGIYTIQLVATYADTTQRIANSTQITVGKKY